MQHASIPWKNGILKISSNHRAMVNGDTPFFWLGDTAWLLLKKLSLEEMETYFENRRSKGFNVIQIMVTHVLPQTNAYGLAPFVENDPACPNTDAENNYWSILDRALDMMEAKGLYAALVPIWGTNYERGFLNEENGAAYAHFLSVRYGKRPNIIWLVGGDILGNVGYAVWNRMGKIFKTECPEQLVTYHPFGSTSSSQWFHKADWLDFNMFQSGHSTYSQIEARREEFIEKGRRLFAEDNWRFAENDLSLSPVKPTIDGEPCYERITKGLKQTGENFWYAPDIRRFAYWSVFFGCCGFTYGHSAVMQFCSADTDEGRAYHSPDTWQQAIHHPAANQMHHLRELMEAVDYAQAQPMPQLLANQKEKEEYVPVLAGEQFFYAYTFTGRQLIFSSELQRRFAGKILSAFWFCPVSGTYSYIGAYAAENLPSFFPPERFEGSHDWVLVCKAE